MQNISEHELLRQIGVNQLIQMFDLFPNTLFWIKDLDSTFVHVNEKFIQHKGLRELSQIVGKTDFDFSPEYMARQYIMDDKKVLENQPVTERLEVNMTQAGDQAWYSTSKRPLKNESNAIVGSYGVTRLLYKQSNALAAVEAVKKPVDYIRQNYQKQFTVETLAKLSHLSVSALERRFKKHLSKTPKQFINEVRLENARRLLIETNSSISQVVEQAGFTDHSYFSKQFRNFFGEQPSELRNNYQNK